MPLAPPFALTAVSAMEIGVLLAELVPTILTAAPPDAVIVPLLVVIVPVLLVALRPSCPAPAVMFSVPNVSVALLLERLTAASDAPVTLVSPRSNVPATLDRLTPA